MEAVHSPRHLQHQIQLTYYSLLKENGKKLKIVPLRKEKYNPNVLKIKDII